MSNPTPSLSATERARSGFLWIISTTAIWQLVSWGLTLITARLLTPTDYGIVSLGEAVIPYLLIVATFRLDTWIVQRKEMSLREEQAASFLVLTLGLVCSLVGFGIGPILGGYYAEERVVAPFQVLSMLFFIKGLSVIPECRLKRELAFKRLAIIHLWFNLFSGVAKLVLAYLGFGYWSLVLGSVAREVLILFVLFRAAGVQPFPRFNRDIVAEAFSFGLAATLSSILWLVFTTTDNLVVGKLFGVELLGTYAMAFFLADLPLSKLNSVVNPIIIPLFSKVRENRDELRRLFRNFFRWMITALAPIFLGLFAVREELISVLLGARWTALTEPLGVMCIVCLIRSLTGNASQLLFATGKPKIVLRWTCLVVAAIVPSFIGLGYLFGMNGIYLSWLLVFPLVGVIPMLITVARELNLKLPDLLRPLLPGILSAILMLGITLTTAHIFEAGLIRLIGKMIIGAFSYVGCMFLIFPAEFRQLRQELRLFVTRRGAA